jgi:cobalt-zinc-cadmium efflux system protein
MHEHSHNRHGKAFALGIGLNLLFVAIEVFYGLAANSSALLADAGHNAGDVLSLIFAWTAARLAGKKPAGKYTYGLRKTTILVSLANALLLFAAVAAIAWDALGKLSQPEPVAGPLIMIVAGIGFFINLLTAGLFHAGRKQDLNIKGAFLHMAADAAVSLGVVLSGLAIYLTGYLWIDPMVSFAIVVVIIWGTWSLFVDSLDLALDAVPKSISFDEVRDFLLSQPGVAEIHDLHIWAMSTTEVALTVHLVMPPSKSPAGPIRQPDEEDSFIRKLQHELKQNFGIDHTTFQIEQANLQGKDHPCSKE